MKFGINSAILGHYEFEPMIDFAQEVGYECVEVCCWPRGKAERRYAGVSHIDVATLTHESAKTILAYCAARNIDISALAYYPNVLDADVTVRETSINHLKKVIDAAVLLDVATVTTFIGRNHHESLSANLDSFVPVWNDIMTYAEERNIKIAIENCPMLFTEDEWPGGKNLFTSPAVWREVFKRVPSPNLGINYDPSHFVWQHIDYIKPIYEFKDKIFHVHFKDITIHQDKLNDVGIMATPLEYMSPKLPGLGDIKWDDFASALYDIGYDGYACVEVEDKAFEHNNEAIDKSVILSYKYLRQFII